MTIELDLPLPSRTHPAIETTVPVPRQHGALYWTLADALVITKRAVLHIRRVPEQLLDVTVQPVIFVLLFRYVFGGAIATGAISYVNYLMPGIFVQSLAFTGATTAMTLAYDMKKGLIDRFRSLPMARSAVLAGQTVATLIRGFLGVVVMLAVGLVVGFRPGGNPLDWVGAIGLLLLFTFALAWVGAVIGLLVREPETAQVFLFVGIFPLTFASSAFVPTATMPGWLAAFAAHQPVTLTVNAVRALLLGLPVGGAGWGALAWSVGILLVCMPLAVALFRRKTAG